MENKLVKVAMEIIIHAGDGRNYLDKALAEAENFCFAKADEYLKLAEEQILEAHRTHTQILQDEADGNEYGYCLLFNHAQDTLMTIESEKRLIIHLIDVLKIMSEKMKNKG